jgi:hypothetical protein
MAKKKTTEGASFHAEAERLLDESWEEVLAINDLDAARDDELSQKIYSLITDGGSTYPFMLLTQVLGKATDPQLNAVCIQESSELPGAWDARTLASRVAVEWNKSAERPFQGANDDPYVNNPARYKNFGMEMRAKAKKEEVYDALAQIVQSAQDGGDVEAKRLVKLILIEARRSLEANKRDYFGPARTSVDGIMNIVMQFLSVRSNGVRLQLVCYALYKALAEAQPSLGEVTSAPTNAADLSSNRTGDVECSRDGNVSLAVEIKDRPIRLGDLTAAVLKARKNNVDNVLFVGFSNPLFEDQDEVLGKAAGEFARGIDVNFTHFEPHVFQILLQVSPEQRADFLRKVHDALHEKGAAYSHVKHWMELLKNI